MDFGRVSFGNLLLSAPAGAAGTITVHFGEALKNGRVDRSPPGTVRYAKTTLTLRAGERLLAAPPPDERNTRQPALVDRSNPPKNFDPSAPPAVLTPSDWGVILPFRWVEIEGWPGELRPAQVTRQSAYASTWNDEASRFVCSDETLNRIWELCRYSIKATTFAGVYVDGDRERIPYEADAYLNQLSHYATDPDIQMARDTYDHLMRHPTWPTEWASHMVFMAHADWWHTGDKAWIASRFEELKTKLLLDRVGPDGLIMSDERHLKKGDLVDWPMGERDGYVFTRVNTVANAFYLRALELMIELGVALGKDAEVADYTRRLQTGRAAFHAVLFNASSGLYRDGVGTDHSSLHANLFALAFNLVPDEHASSVMAWLRTRGMDCSVYVAQYYMEVLFQRGAASRALDLVLAPGDRSWRHMLDSGTTITWEAWDQKYKPNQDWNHAWGAAPANLFPRFILGVQPAIPGWSKAKIEPLTGGLSRAAGLVPTPHGGIAIAWKDEQTFTIDIELPDGVSAIVSLPAAGRAQGVFSNGKQTDAEKRGDRWILAAEVKGRVKLEVR